MGCEPVRFRGRPCDWPGCAASTNPSLSFVHLVSLIIDREEAAVRYIGLDVHREFCEVAIAEEGRVRSAGRIRTRRAELELFAQSLGSDDEVALESTGGAVTIARILEAHVARVVVVNTKKLRQISEAKAKTDRLDARRLAELLAAGYLAEVWCPDEQTRALRRLVARRAQLVRQRSRAKNESAAGVSSRPSSCPTTSAKPSTAVCARSISSTRRSLRSTARWPRRRSAPRRCAG